MVAMLALTLNHAEAQDVPGLGTTPTTTAAVSEAPAVSLTYDDGYEAGLLAGEGSVGSAPMWVGCASGLAGPCGMAGSWAGYRFLSPNAPSDVPVGDYPADYVDGYRDGYTKGARKQRGRMALGASSLTVIVVVTVGSIVSLVA